MSDGSDEDDLELILIQKPAGLMKLNLPAIGGWLVLTERRLAFFPLISENTLGQYKFFGTMAQKLQHQPIGPSQIAMLIRPRTKTLDIPLADIESVKENNPGRRHGIFTVTLHTTQGARIYKFSVTARWAATVFSKQNDVARDELISALRTAQASLPD